MNRWTLNFLLTFLTITSASANPDSLSLVLKLAESDIERVDALNNLARFYIDYSFEKSINYGLEALDLSKMANYTEGEATANLNLGWMYWENSYYDEAISHLNTSTQLFEVLEDVPKLPKSNHLLGLLYFYTVKEDSSLKYLNQSRKQYVEIQDSTSLALLLTELSFLYEITGNTEASNNAAVEAYTIKLTGEALRTQYGTWMESGHVGQAYQNENILHSLLPENRLKFALSKSKGDLYKFAQASSKIGDLFQVLGSFDSSIWYHEISLNIYDSLNESRGKADELARVGECYLLLGDSSRAKDIFEEVYNLRLRENDHPGLGLTLDYLGRIALNENQFEKALYYFEKAVTLSDTLGHLLDVVRFNRRLSDTFRSMGKFEQAIETANRSYLIAQEMGSLSHRTWGAEKLHLAYKESKNFQKAVEYLAIYNDLSIQREKNVLSRENLQFQSVFELNDKARKIELLSRQNDAKQSEIDLQRSYLISAISGVLIVLVFALFFYDRVRKIGKLNRKVSEQNISLQSMNSEKEVLLKEIHHRVKNNLQMVSSLLGMQKRRVKDMNTRQLFSYTQNRLKSMGLIHEHLYKNDTLSTIILRPYVEDLVNSILSSLCNEIKPTTKLDIPSYEVDIDTAIPLGLMINELITNAVKYAFADNPTPSLEISIQEIDGILRLVVKDDGPGGVVTQNGFGWTIINSMVQNLSGSVALESKGGLEVTIILKDYKISA
ncbi:MAG: histidine kinase dimerization/phosphoacceptor domain -containing protein [Cyclobacteriaceae bacterium]